jgi:hypothetical protein
MNRAWPSFFGTFVVFLLFGAGALLAHGDVKLLPPGTVITYPDGHTMTLSSSSFLLSRDESTDTFALKPDGSEVPLGLQVLHDDQAKLEDPICVALSQPEGSAPGELR